MSEYARMDGLKRSFTMLALLGAVLLLGAIAVAVIGIDSGGRAAAFGGLCGAGALSVWAGLRGRRKCYQSIWRLCDNARPGTP